MRAVLLAVLLSSPLPAWAESQWVTWDSPAWGYIGTNPHNRDHALYLDQDGVFMGVIWEAENATIQDIAECRFELEPSTGGSRRGAACPAELVVDVFEDDGRQVLVVKRLVALGQPGQEVTFD